MNRYFLFSSAALTAFNLSCRKNAAPVVSDVKSTTWTHANGHDAPQSPPEGATAVSGIEMLKVNDQAGTPTPTLMWTPHEEAAFYEVKIDDSETCTSPEKVLTTQDTTVKSPYLENGKYYTCVTAFDDEGKPLAEKESEVLVLAKDAVNPEIQNTTGGSGAALDEGTTKDATLALAQPIDDTALNLGFNSQSDVSPFTFGVYSDPNQDAKLKLVVNDRENARILIWNTVPKTQDTPPDRVIGQADKSGKKLNAGSRDVHNAGFADPTSAVLCTDGKLIVTDRGNNRVLIWRSIPDYDGAPAEIVLGQKHFAARETSTSRDGFNQPFSAYCFGKKLFVLDRGNHRILGYHKFPDHNGAPADFVIGQSSFKEKKSGCGRGLFGSISDMGFDGKKFYVVDSSNHRVLVYDSLPESSSTLPDNVIGQPDFDSCKANRGKSPTLFSLESPTAIAFHPKRLAISDTGNNRVVVFGLPLQGDPKAQLELTTQKHKIKEPRGLLFEGDSHLIINDLGQGQLTKATLP